MNLNKILKTIKGNDANMSFPSQEEISSGAKETIKNVLLNCLASYPVKKDKQIFVVNTLATNILNSDGEIEFSKDEISFLKEVLYKTTFREEEDGKEKGVYLPFMIGQVLLELGIKE